MVPFTIFMLLCCRLIFSQRNFDCEGFVRPIRERQVNCSSMTDTEAHICVIFSSDYDYLMPFLVHHLGIGFKHIWVYNNDQKKTWYKHPGILCLIAEELVSVQVWYGINQQYPAQNHCFKKLPEVVKATTPSVNVDKLWGAVFDIDEYLVLHEDSCVNLFLDKFNAPGVAITWAMFLLELPLTNHSRTGIHHRPLRLRHEASIDHEQSDPFMPHEMILRRQTECGLVKTIARVICVNDWSNPHNPNYKPCNYGNSPVDSLGHSLKAEPFTPYTDNGNYRVAQLNHYWTLSLAHFLDKIHRGYADRAESPDRYRSTDELFQFAHPQKGKMIDDLSFMARYGDYFSKLRNACNECFDVRWY